jgi:amidophosphoribosyltransferase
MKGVIGVFSEKHVAQKGVYLLYGVQHRGQESAGLSAAGDRSLRTWNGLGLVSRVFDEKFQPFIHPDDYIAIGNASGENINSGPIPPVKFETKRHELSLTLDGLVPEGRNLPSEKVLGSMLLKEIDKGEEISSAITRLMNSLTEAYYSLIMILRDKKEEESRLIAARDRRGIKPLYMASNEEMLFLASESAPIDVMENMGEKIAEMRDFPPGSMIIRDKDGFTEKQVLDPKPAHCAFEWVYFGRPDSVIEGKNVHTVRKRLGQAIVDTHTLKTAYQTNGRRICDMVIIPIPDSGRSICTGVAEALGVPADEGVIKNAYLGRTYIIDNPEFRRVASDLKHNIIKNTVEKKRVIITDDSIVRGTVSESVAQNLIKSGAQEVDFLVSYAPIFYPCFPDPPDKPLAAAAHEGKSLEEIGRLIASELPSINKVWYNSPENVIWAIDLPKDSLCTFCITGDNPFENHV